MKDYGLQAIGDRIIVLQDKAPDQVGSIILAEVAKERPLEGTVVGLGTNESFYVKIGDRVLFTAYNGTELKAGQADDEKLLVMREQELLCVRRASVASNVAVKAGRVLSRSA